MSWNDNDDSLLIDERSASVPVSAEDLALWAAHQRVFVSSLITDMPAERAAVRAAIQDIGAEPVMFEDELGGQDIPADRAYLDGVRSSNIYVGIWGPHYGVRMADGDSATHAEFRQAEKAGLRLAIFVGDASHGIMDRDQRDLVAGARNLYTTATYSDPSNLAERVANRMKQLAAEDLRPWVRVGRTVFRTRSIMSDGQTIVIDATTASDAVHAELVRLRDRTSEVPFASLTDARDARVRALTTTTVSTARHDEHLTLQAGSRPSSSGWATSGMTADQVRQRALEDGLFQRAVDRSPFGSTAMLLTPVDPLLLLRSRPLADDVLRPVARLLITEHLLRSGTAATVDAFALGPAHQGRRWVRVTWTPINPYSNVRDPDPVTLEGELSGL